MISSIPQVESPLRLVNLIVLELLGEVRRLSPGSAAASATFITSSVHSAGQCVCETHRHTQLGRRPVAVSGQCECVNVSVHESFRERIVDSCAAVQVCALAHGLRTASICYCLIYRLATQHDAVNLYCLEV